MKTSRSRAFTLIELLVVVAIIGILIAILIPTLARVKEITRRGVCAANLKAQADSFAVYAAQCNDAVPTDTPFGSAIAGINWLWDEPVFFGDQLLLINPAVSSSTLGYDSLRKIFYCPSDPVQNADGLWNFSPVRVMGYTYFNDRSTAFTGIIGFVPARASPQRYNRKYTTQFRASSVEMGFDAIIQDATTLSFTFVQGGYSVAHTTSHLAGANPAGQNVMFCDGHTEWRAYSASKASYINTGPHFWLTNQ